MQVKSKNTIGKFFLAISVSLFLTAIVNAQNVSLARNDNQLWHETSVSVSLNERLSLVFTGALRVGRDFKHLVDERAGVGLAYKLNRNLTIFGGYLYRGAQPDARRRGFENRGFGGFTVSAPVAKFVLSNRNSLEHRANNSRPDALIYRNRSTIERNVRIFDSKLKPYFAFEVFYDGRLDRWYRQRYTIGASKNLNKKLVGEVFYLRQQDAVGRPGNLNVIGSALRVQL